MALPFDKVRVSTVPQSQTTKPTENVLNAGQTNHRRKRRYSAVHVHNIRRSSTDKSKTSLIRNVSAELTMSPFDLKSMHSSLNNQEKLDCFAMRTFSDKMISPPSHISQLSQSSSYKKSRLYAFTHLQWINRSPVYSESIITSANGTNKTTTTSIRNTSSSSSNKVIKLSLM